jgi:hypothetical protein
MQYLTFGDNSTGVPVDGYTLSNSSTHLFIDDFPLAVASGTFAWDEFTSEPAIAPRPALRLAIQIGREEELAIQLGREEDPVTLIVMSPATARALIADLGAVSIGTVFGIPTAIVPGLADDVFLLM